MTLAFAAKFAVSMLLMGVLFVGGIAYRERNADIYDEMELEAMVLFALGVVMIVLSLVTFAMLGFAFMIGMRP